MKLVISPHNDDEGLFVGYTIARVNPLVLVVYDSYVQPARGFPKAGLIERQTESQIAVLHLARGLAKVRFCGLRDDTEYSSLQIFESICKKVPEEVDEIWAPAYEEGGHAQHNLVAMAADNFGCLVHRYTTYTRHLGRTRTPNVVQPANGDHVIRKLLALSAYRSQIEIEELGCRSWFTSGLDEYLA